MSKVKYNQCDCKKETTELIRAGQPQKETANMSKAVEILKRMEWGGTYSYCTGWPCCPVCKGIKPGYGRDSDGVLPFFSGHSAGCKLNESIKDVDAASTKNRET